MSNKTNYELEAAAAAVVAAPELDYRPRLPMHYRPRIGLIGCGGITAQHLAAYKADGLSVVAFCDVREEAARRRAEEYYPGAAVFTDYHDLLARPDIDVVDIALHPEPRAFAIEAALEAGKHVLSQKPFVLDLDVGERLADLADRKNRYLAVNQNGRWAPYVRWMIQAVRNGLIGELQTAQVHVNWDHTWVKDTPFDKIHHLVLYDFAIHWFDMVAQFFHGRPAVKVFASTTKPVAQPVTPPLVAGAHVLFSDGQAQLSFNGFTLHGANEGFELVGSGGTLRSRGSVCGNELIELTTARGVSQPRLKGKWFPDGFRGSMGELLCAIEESRPPENAARENLRSLALCFAAIASADSGKVVDVSSARRLGQPAVAATAP